MAKRKSKAQFFTKEELDRTKGKGPVEPERLPQPGEPGFVGIDDTWFQKQMEAFKAAHKGARKGKKGGKQPAAEE